MPLGSASTHPQSPPPNLVTRRLGNSSERPHHLPVLVLWTLSDAKRDEAIKMMQSNQSHPSIHQLCQKADGTVVDEIAYSNIRASGRHVIAYMLMPCTAKYQDTNPEKPGQCNKTFFKAHFQDAWLESLLQLEVLQPILGLCAEHYKAEFVLQSVLTHLPKDSPSINNMINPGVGMEENLAEEGSRNAKRPQEHLSPRSPKRNKSSNVPKSIHLTCM